MQFPNKIVRRRLVGKAFRGYQYLPIAPASGLQAMVGWPQPVADVIAYGTGEGAKRGWDTRGRGRAAKPQALVGRYHQLGNTIAKLHGKVHSAEEAHSVAGKLMHLIKALGEWIEPYRNLGELLLGSYWALHTALNQFSTHANWLMQVATWAHQHIGPAVQTVASLGH